MCVFDKGKPYCILEKKECSPTCKFRRTKQQFENDRIRADRLFKEHTGCDPKHRMDYVRSHAPKEV